MTKRGNASGGSGRTSSRRARRRGWLFARTAGAALSIAGSAHLASAQAYKLRVLDTPEGINATRVVAERISEDGDTIGGFAVAADGQAYEVIWLLAPINNQAPGVYLREKVRFLTEYSNLEPTGSEVGGAQPNRQELPFSWTFASGHVLLPVPEGVTWGAAWDGNLVGEMVGYVDWETPQPLRWASITSMPEALTLAEGFTQGVAYGNNNLGDAVGLMGLPAAQDLRRPPRVEDDMSRNAGLVQPVLWPAAGPAVLLQERLVGVPDGLSLLGVHGINDARWMVGEAFDRSPGRSRAVVYFPAQADATGDGVVDDGDLTVFLERLAARDPRSDVSSDGAFDHADAAQFLERFEARDAGGNLPTATLVPVSKALYTLSQGAFPDDDLTAALFGKRQRTVQEIHNPECYGCAGTHPRNPWAPHGAPGWPGDHPRNPYAPHGGAGGHGAPGGDGGPGGHGAPGGNGGRGGDGGKCGSGGDGGNGGVDGHGGSGGNGGLNGRGGNGGDGGPGSAGKPGGRGGAGAQAVVVRLRHPVVRTEGTVRTGRTGARDTSVASPAIAEHDAAAGARCVPVVRILRP